MGRQHAVPTYRSVIPRRRFLIGAKARRRLTLGLPLELKPSHVSKVVNNVFYQLRPIFRVRSSVCSRLMSPATHDAALALSLPLSASERSSSWELPHHRRPFDDIMMATFLGRRTGFIRRIMSWRRIMDRTQRRSLYTLMMQRSVASVSGKGAFRMFLGRINSILRYLDTSIFQAYTRSLWLRYAARPQRPGPCRRSQGHKVIIENRNHNHSQPQIKQPGLGVKCPT